ncbi:hypothetical protein B0J11DRAFT_596654 [Dendryphion nanum]|uniref:Uncharacterized protein n=1 Tax=Dendryphion nanum TaxID=256645 RepID=A0A9P9EEA8_9PLEO|nr:hypothetical protein B0J11DRAFT_596654 [Dendryphion nanum]
MAGVIRRVLTFDNRYKFRVHILILILIITVMVITVVRIFTKSGPTTRSDTMALAMGAKSLIIIAYELLSEHTQRFRKWSSLKAYAILNGLEVVFWSAVCFLSMQGLMKNCTGTSCALGWVAFVIAVFVVKFELYMAIVSYLDFRHFKRYSKHRGVEV